MNVHNGNVSVVHDGHKDDKNKGLLSSKRKKDKSLVKGRRVASKTNDKILNRGNVCICVDDVRFKKIFVELGLL